LQSRRHALQTIAGAAAAAPAILRGARRAGDRPNLLFIWTDQQRADTMAAYGNTRFHVPSMNRLAAESVVFERAYVTQPVCTPSRSSVMTGLWPHQNGCIRNNIALRADTRTVPALLGSAGYRTAYMGKWHLGDEIFPQHGFAEWKAIEDGIYQNHYSAGRDKSARSAYHHFLVSQGYEPDDEKNKSFSRKFATTLPVEQSKPSFLATEASRFMLEHRADPWLLYVNFLEPHSPYASVLNDLHSEEDAPLLNYPGIPSTPEPEWYKRRRAQLNRTDRAGFQRTARNYAGLCSLVDQALGRILWTLEATGQAANTVVVYTSDHGDMMGSHSMLAKQVMYEESIRVPHLLRVPFRNQKPMRVPHPVSHIDIVPTVLDLLGAKSDGLPGRSLVPALEGRRPPEDVFLEWNEDSSDSGKGPSGRTCITPDGNKLAVYDTDQSLLFDRSRDPQEMNNLYGTRAAAAVQSRLRKKIDEWQKRTGDRLALPS
jgi:arylsulfatase A-like enzyme